MQQIFLFLIVFSLGNAYSIRNLRKDEAKLIYFQHRGGEVELRSEADTEESS